MNNHTNGAPPAVDARACSGGDQPQRGFAPRLRRYQLDAIDAARQAIVDGCRNLLLVAPTGSGKSVIFAEIARRALQRSNARVLVVAHRRELVGQAVGHLHRSGLTNVRTFLGGTSLGAHDAPVSVAAVQTLNTARWRDRFPPASLVIWDEAHHVIADSFRNVHAAYPNAIHLGLTATPERSDGSPLGDVFQRLIVVASIRELVASGHLVSADVWAPPETQSALAEDAADAYLERGDGRRAIVFAANIPHSRAIAAALVASGVHAEHVDGSTPAKERDAILRRFATGQTRVITNCTLISEGFDVPACKCVVIARGCDSVAMYLQAIGRALRPVDGDTSPALVLDLRGAVHKHGLPDADRQFSLEGRAIRDGDKPDPVRQCLDCGRVFRPTPKCPFCGATVREPEPPEVRRARLERIFAAHDGDQRRAYFDRLCEEAARKKYRHGWIAVRFKARYHEWPKFGDYRRAATVAADSVASAVNQDDAFDAAIDQANFDKAVGE